MRIVSGAGIQRVKIFLILGWSLIFSPNLGCTCQQNFALIWGQFFVSQPHTPVLKFCLVVGYNIGLCSLILNYTPNIGIGISD